MAQSILTHTIEAIALSDDVTATRAVEYIFNRLNDSPSTHNDEALDQQTHPTIQSLLQFITESEGRLLCEAESIKASRWLLCQFAKEADGSLLVQEALRLWNDDTQRVGVQLSYGLIATLLLIFATTEVRIEGHGFSLHKKAFVPSQIDAILNVKEGALHINTSFSPPSPTSSTEQKQPTLPHTASDGEQ